MQERDATTSCNQSIGQSSICFAWNRKSDRNALCHARKKYDLRCLKLWKSDKKAFDEIKQEYADEKLAEVAVKSVGNVMEHFHVSLEEACDGLGYSLEQYYEAKRLLEEEQLTT